MSASMLLCSKCIKDMIESRPRFNPQHRQTFSNGKKWWGLMFWILQLPISIIQVSFWASLSLQKNPMGSPAESQSRSIREQKSLCVNLEKLSAVEKEKSTRPLITHCVNLDETKCSSSRRKTRRREERRMKEWRHHQIISPRCVKNRINHLNNYCKNINIVVVELKNTDFRWSKRDGPLWAVHIFKKRNINHNCPKVPSFIPTFRAFQILNVGPWGNPH